MPTISTKKDISIDKIKPFFNWFEQTFSGLIAENISNIFGFTPNIKLFSLEKNSKNFFVGNDYFVTQATISTLDCTIRISETACEMFLINSLGTNNEKFFKLANMTNLEATVITKFNNDLFKSIKEFLLNKQEVLNLKDKDVEFKDNLYFGFVINDETNNFEIGKLFLTIPENLIKFPDKPEFQGGIDTTKFTKATTLVDIFIGKTKLSLDDINHMEQEDIVVLENSNIKKMEITYPASIKFNINPDPRLFINEDNEEEDTNMEDIGVSTKDIWDDVQVDVCAKFPKVKMSLGELREMSEGLVMELDSVYGNEVVLEVENRNIAKGELVIIGYKYGVKITEILSQNEPEPVQEVEEIQEDNLENSEDFDVQDFEIKE